jgi:hypothetical protein
MTQYLGRMYMMYWLEADSIEDADKKLDAMLDHWDKATPAEITWDGWDRTIEEDREPQN